MNVTLAKEWTALDEPAAETAPRFTFYTAAEFDALDLRRDYHIPGILAAGAVPTVLAGSFKTLKTSIAADLLWSLSTGSRFLHHYPVARQTNVALMSGESGGFALQNLLRRIALSRGWLASGPGEHLRICTAVPGLSCKDDMKVLEQFIDEHSIRVIAIDPTYLAMRGLRADDAGNLFAVGALLDPLTRMAERTGCTPIVVHHNSRGATRANAGEPADLADIAWSGFAEWAGQWMLLSRRECFNPDSAGEHHLWLSAGGRDGHATLAAVNVTEGRQDDPGGRRWDVEIEKAAGTRAAAAAAEQERKEAAKKDREARQLEQDMEVVAEVLKGVPDGTTKRQLRGLSGVRTARFDAAFFALLKADRLDTCTVKAANGQEYEGYKLPLGRTGTHWDDPVRPSGKTHTGTPPLIEASQCLCACDPVSEPTEERPSEGATQ